MILSTQSTQSDTPAKPAIPDCCNAGVIFRALAAVNAAVLADSVLRSDNWQAGILDFIEASVLVELATLGSLMALCILRRVLRPAPPWAQRLSCMVVPAGLTGFVIHLFSGLNWLWSGFPHLTTGKGMLAAGMMGGALLHYFDLRGRAFSPVLVEARLQALQARIRPHFLFNSLNAVLALIRTEPRRAESTLEDLADLFRVFMRDSRAMTTLAEEIRLCRQYLAIEKLRLGERLEVAWELENLPDHIQDRVRMPALLLQPLLENAVRYGVEPAGHPVMIRIQIGRSIDRIHIAVVNPYDNKASPESGNHMALNNIRERLALLYDVEAELSTASGNGRFEVRLHFPSFFPSYA